MPKALMVIPNLHLLINKGHYSFHKHSLSINFEPGTKEVFVLFCFVS